MIRKFNYTGRRKLSRKRINISVIDGKPYNSFSASLDLKGLNLTDDAKIYIEPYYKSSFMRFPFGTVANEDIPASTTLTDIPSTDVIQFRVKVVDESNKIGRIIRMADKIKANRPEDSGNRISILQIDWSKDLDQQIFRVTFPPNDFPILEINKRIENRKELVKNNLFFRALVFPSVLKEIALKLVMTWKDKDFEEGDDSWQSMWLKFISDVLHVNIDEDFDETDEEYIYEWVDEVVSAFCRKNKFRSRLEQTLNKIV